MADRKRPSGAHYYKRKAEKAKAQAKQKGLFLEYLRTQKANQEQEYDCTLVETSIRGAECGVPTINDRNSKTEVSQIGDISGKHTEEKKDVKKSESTAKSAKEDGIVPDLNYSDPAN